MTTDREPDMQTALRIPIALVDRIDKLAEEMSKPGLRVTRTEVMRLALFEGVGRMEKKR